MNISISRADSESIAQAVAGLSMQSKKVQSCFYTAIGRAISRSRNRVAHDIAKELELPLKEIRRRVKSYKMPARGEAKFWCGLNGIPFDSTGKPTQRGNDVEIKGVTFKNAYIAKTKLGETIVISKATGGRAMIEIHGEATRIILQRLPYYMRTEFDKNFSQILN